MKITCGPGLCHRLYGPCPYGHDHGLPCCGRGPAQTRGGAVLADPTRGRRRSADGHWSVHALKHHALHVACQQFSIIKMYLISLC